MQRSRAFPCFDFTEDKVFGVTSNNVNFSVTATEVELKNRIADPLKVIRNQFFSNRYSFFLSSLKTGTAELNHQGYRHTEMNGDESWKASSSEVIPGVLESDTPCDAQTPNRDKDIPCPA